MNVYNVSVDISGIEEGSFIIESATQKVNADNEHTAIKEVFDTYKGFFWYWFYHKW